MTLIEVIDSARDLTNEPLASSRTFPDNTSGFWQDSTLIRYFNIVQQDIAQEIIQAYEDYFLTATDLNITDGCANYSLPTDFFKVRRLEDKRNSNNPVEIQPVGLNTRTFSDVLVQNDSATIQRGGYYLRGASLVFEDTPAFTDSAAVTLHYIKILPDVSNATASSEIPSSHHRLLVWGLVKYMMHSQEADATVAEREYLRMLNNLKREVENRQVQKPRTVRTSRSRRRF